MVPPFLGRVNVAKDGLLGGVMGLRQILAHAAAYPLAAVLGVEDTTVRLAAEASAALGLPHNPPEAARRRLDSREKLLACGERLARIPSSWWRQGTGVGIYEVKASVLQEFQAAAESGTVSPDFVESFFETLDDMASFSGDAETLMNEFARLNPEMAEF